MKLTISISCFNEKPTILEAIREAKALPIEKEILVIDNSSTDGTKEILKEIYDKSLKIVIKDKNYGAWHSGKMAVDMAQGEYLYAPGADLEYRMIDVLEMFKKMQDENLDIVFGSRLLGRKETKWQLFKERPFWLGAYIAAFFINILYGKKFTDVIAPKLIKTSILRDVNFGFRGHAGEFELVSWLCKKGYKISEVPISYKPRTHKEGKTISVFDIFPGLWAILKVKMFN